MDGPRIVRICGKDMVSVTELAKGGFGDILLCKEVTGRQFVAKRMLAQAEENIKQLEFEAKLLGMLKHPNIVKCFGLQKRKHPRGGLEVVALFEYLPGGDMLALVRSRKGRRFKEGEVLVLFENVLKSVTYLHAFDPPIAHRDLKPENVLHGRTSSTWALCDFGSCSTRRGPIKDKVERVRVEDEIERFTTPIYRAPEQCDLYSGFEVDERVDLWALGVILYILCFLKHPFEGYTALGVLSGKYTIPKDCSYSEELISLMRGCLTIDPSLRPTSGEMLDHVQFLKSRGTSGKLWESKAPPEVKREKGRRKHKSKRKDKKVSDVEEGVRSIRLAAAVPPPAPKPKVLVEGDLLGDDWGDSSVPTDDWFGASTSPTKTAAPSTPVAATSAPLSIDDDWASFDASALSPGPRAPHMPLGGPSVGTPTAGTPTAGTPTAGTPTAGTPAAGPTAPSPQVAYSMHHTIVSGAVVDGVFAAPAASAATHPVVEEEDEIARELGLLPTGGGGGPGAAVPVADDFGNADDPTLGYEDLESFLVAPSGPSHSSTSTTAAATTPAPAVVDDFGNADGFDPFA